MKKLDSISQTTFAPVSNSNAVQTVSGAILLADQTLPGGQSSTQRPFDLQIKDLFAKINPIFFRLFNMAYPPFTTLLNAANLSDIQSYTGSNDVNKKKY